MFVNLISEQHLFHQIFHRLTIEYYSLYHLCFGINVIIFAFEIFCFRKIIGKILHLIRFHRIVSRHLYALVRSNKGLN